jgi:NAD(P)-dependent dehydrogenase (short-subunit alcohol dehydrogenase family)
MAKASLNMMTRTAAIDYAESNIYMNCVDTGWITDENPLQTAVKIAESGFVTPIDETDAAARILDPILSSENSGQFTFGQFYKDFHLTEW